MQDKSLGLKNNFISLRASTSERLLVESLMVQMNVDKKSELIRSLINDRATALGLAQWITSKRAAT